MPYTPRPYKITGIKNLADDVKVFRIRCSMNPSPGRFMQVSIPGVGECPLTSCSYDPKYVDLLVRKAGNVTSALFRLKKGDRVFIRGPYGKGFPLNKIQKKKLILVAGGTGIAPVTSLIGYIEKNRREFGSVDIYFGFKDEGHILLKDKIRGWRKKFNIVVCLNKRVKDKKCEEGFVHEIMGKHWKNKDNKDTLAFLCGPEIMMDCVTKELNSFGMGNNKIYWSLERRMECAMGNCGRCLIQDLYVCKDGPVFRYDLIKPKIENEKASNEDYKGR